MLIQRKLTKNKRRQMHGKKSRKELNFNGRRIKWKEDKSLMNNKSRKRNKPILKNRKI